MDVYEQLAVKAFGDASPEHRRLAKNSVFAASYGGDGALYTTHAHHQTKGYGMIRRLFIGLCGLVALVIAGGMLIVSPMLAMAFDAPDADPTVPLLMYFGVMVAVAVNGCVTLATAIKGK